MEDDRNRSGHFLDGPGRHPVQHGIPTQFHTAGLGESVYNMAGEGYITVQLEHAHLCVEAGLCRRDPSRTRIREDVDKVVMSLLWSNEFICDLLCLCCKLEEVGREVAGRARM